MIPKTYGELKRGNELDAFHGKRLKRCRVATTPRMAGRFVEVQLCPVTRGQQHNLIKFRFDASATVEVYEEKTVYTPKDDFKTQNLVMEVLRPGEPCLSPHVIQERIASQIQKTNIWRVRAACKALASRGTLIQKSVGYGSGMLAYRLPLSSQITGLAVVEQPGKKSQRLGWIEEWKLFAPTGQLQPVCRWIDGTRSFSSDILLEPCTDRIALQQIETCQRLARGEKIQRPIDLPEWLLYEFRMVMEASGNGRFRQQKELFLELAKRLDFIPFDTHPDSYLKGETRNQVLSYLERYYPGWRTGVVPFQSAA